jgi:CO/xanthine dehydrogenase Mo-binding subunit
MNEIMLERRQFLQAGGALVIGFALAPIAPASSQQAPARGAFPLRAVEGDSVDSFLVIERNGTVTLYSGRVDLGTGLRASYRQIVAEELDVPYERIVMIDGDTALTPDQGGTGGSTAIVGAGMLVRQAAATARQALLKLASERLSVPVEQLTVADGVVRASNGRSVAYGELIGGGRFDLKSDRAAPLKNAAQYKYVGKSLPRPDLPDKMTGRHTFVHDFKLPNMLHARIIRPTAIGATLAEVDDSSIANIPGARVVRIQSFLAVVAEKEWNAVRASRQLRVRWTGGGNLPGSDRVYAMMRASPAERNEDLIKNGNSAAAMQGNGVRRLNATYEWPAQSHASMGPSCGVADAKDGQITVWSASQGTHRARQVIARALNMPENQVRVVYLDGAGCYGMNGHDDAAAEAALLSHTLRRPVRVQWSREEETGWDPKGPPQLLDLRAALDANGNIAAWETEAWLPMNTPNLFSRPLISLVAAGIPQPDGQAVAQVQGNAYPPYDLANMTATVHWLKTTPLRPSNLRAPGKLGNCYAVECFMDELAAAAGRDPLEYRLHHLKDEQGAAILRRAAEMMSWRSRPSPQRASQGDRIASGRAIVYVHYKHIDNRMGLGVELIVDRDSGRVRVDRVVCAYEAGLMINPDVVRSQIEGNILQAVSRTLYEETTFDQNRVTSVDWQSYPILTFPDSPAIEIDLIGSPFDKPMGAGEAASAPVPAAIGNAVFDAVGIRMRRVPLTPERVRAALAAGGQASL